MSTRTQPAQLGFRAKQTRRPWRIKRKEKRPRSSRRDERVEIELGLHRVGLVRELQPARESPDVGVDGQAGQVERHRSHDVAGLAPDARQLHQIVEFSGYFAVELFVELARHPEQVLRLRAEEPRGVHDASTASGSACARSRGVGYFANSSGVTLLTFSSVVWAERIVAASNWNALSCTSAHSASGYSCARRSITIAARAFAPLGRATNATLGRLSHRPRA